MPSAPGEGDAESGARAGSPSECVSPQSSPPSMTTWGARSSTSNTHSSQCACRGGGGLPPESACPEGALCSGEQSSLSQPDAARSQPSVAPKPSAWRTATRSIRGSEAGARTRLNRECARARAPHVSATPSASRTCAARQWKGGGARAVGGARLCWRLYTGRTSIGTAHVLRLGRFGERPQGAQMEVDAFPKGQCACCGRFRADTQNPHRVRLICGEGGAGGTRRATPTTVAWPSTHRLPGSTEPHRHCQDGKDEHVTRSGLRGDGDVSRGGAG